MITELAVNWYVSSGRYLYLFFNAGLFASALFAFIVGGTAKENAIAAPKSPVGLRLFRFWMSQNAIIAILSVISFAFMYTLTAPEYRHFLLPPLW
ncbi:MAG: hypothetical protein SFV81_30350 [Pirellulaceae bacterium]|nr:hypothetical protein [Pirellulaceae bacterium]